jgi:hypothetical protein
MPYAEAVREVQQWLATRQKGEQVYVLLDHGYDDLSAIALANEEEVRELVVSVPQPVTLRAAPATHRLGVQAIFPREDDRRVIRVLVECLRKVGVDAFRKSPADFVKAVSAHESKVRGRPQAMSRGLHALSPCKFARRRSRRTSRRRRRSTHSTVSLP